MNPQPPEPDDAGCGDDTAREVQLLGEHAEPDYEEIEVSPL